MSLHHILRQLSDKTISTEGQSKPPKLPQVFFLNLYYMKDIKTDLPDHLKLYIKVILLQNAPTGNAGQKGAGFKWFGESLKHLGCCAVL